MKLIPGLTMPASLPVLLGSLARISGASGFIAADHFEGSHLVQFSPYVPTFAPGAQ